MIFNRRSLRFNVTFSILAMGALSIVLAVLGTEIYRQFAIDSQRNAIEKVIGLEVAETMGDMRHVVRSMGQSLRDDVGFQREFRAHNIDALQRSLASPFHQYFVTAGILRPRYLAVYDVDLNLLTSALADDQAEVASCGNLRRVAMARKGPARLRNISELCLRNGRPYFSMLLPIGGLKVRGYIEIVVDPVFSLRELEDDLGMPLRIAYADGATVYVSERWQAAIHREEAIANYVLKSAAGERALLISMAQDISTFESRLKLTRDLVIVVVTILGLLLAALMLLILNKNTLIPLHRLGEQLRKVHRDREQLGREIIEEGNAEVRFLASGFNEMTAELKSLYDMLLARQSELQSEVCEREQAQKELQIHRDQLEEQVHQRTLDLAQARDAALAASQSKSQFLANMSHELRTPLNAVIGYSELLMDDARQRGEKSLEEDLCHIHTAGQHLLMLINDILDLSKIEAGKMQLHEEWFSVADLVNDVVDTIRPLAAKNSNQLSMHCADDVALMHADVTKLRQILFNLLSNACKFTLNGEISVNVRCGTDGKMADSGGQIIFSVTDTGIGIAPEQMDEIFAAFNQADLTTTRKYGGTGLGLAITQHFCHLMGGAVHVVSSEGKGSTFSVMLPLKNVGENTLLDIDNNSDVTNNDIATLGQRLTQRREGAMPERRKKTCRVLVIDDDPAIRHIMSHFLTLKDFDVTTASSGTEGLALAEVLLPDVITLDVMMPGMDGWAVLRELKQSSQLRDIPVVMLTLVEDRAMAETLGAAAYMSKPIDKLRLFDIIYRCVRKEAETVATGADH